MSSIGGAYGLTVCFLDSGMGDCTLVVFPSGQLMLVDCGSKKNRDAVKPQIVKALQLYLPANNNVIDWLVITHPDADHFNMLMDVLEQTNATVTTGWFGGDVKLYKCNDDSNATYNFLTQPNTVMKSPGVVSGPKPPSPGVVVGPKKPLFSRDGVQVTMLACNASGAPAASALKNANSIVLLLTYSGPGWTYKVFLMGDATAFTEKAILNHTSPADLKNLFATTLKMGHHGSLTSSCQEWVSALQPNALVISADTRKFNGTGMPSRDQLNQVVSWTKLAPMVAHPVVEFNDTADPKVFTTRTWKQAVCSTLWTVNNADPTKDKGFSWWLKVTSDGLVALDPSPTT